MALVKTVELRILASAGDAQAKLDEVAAKADDLGAKGVRMRFRLDDGAGKAQLDELRAKADRLGLKDVTIKVRVDGAGRAIAELEAVKKADDPGRFRNLVGRLFGLGAADAAGAGGGGGGPSSLAGGGLMSPAGIAALAAGAAALLPELTGLVSGFSAAGAGAAAFYVLAHPAINNLQQDIQALGKANQNLGFAQQTEQLDPTKAHLKALQAAQLKYNAIYAQMGQDAGGAAAGVLKLHDSYVKLTDAFAPQAFKVFNDGLKIANHLLPQAKPFADTFATSLDGLLKRFDRFTQSKGFGDWLKQFHSLEGPAVGAIGDGIGKVAVAFGKLMTTMSGKDVAHAINIAFGGAAATIGIVAGAVKILMNYWDHASANVSHGAHQIASAFDSIRHGAAGIGHDFAHSFDSLRHFNAAAFGGIVSFFSGLPGKIRGFFAGAGGWLTSAGSAAIHGLEHGATSAWGAVSGWFSGLGGKIRGFFAGAGGWLLGIGHSIIQGLINGISSMLGPLEGIVGKAVGIIKGIAGFLGIHSPSTVMFGYGQAIMDGLTGGIASRQPALGAQMAGVTQTIHGSMAGHGYGRGGDEIHLHFEAMVHTPESVKTAVQAFREYKRHGGGAPLGIA